MPRMSPIERQAAEAAFGAFQQRKNTQEEPAMAESASKLTDAARAADDSLKYLTEAASHLAALASNGLIAELDAGNLGRRLTPEQRQAVLVIVRGMEERSAGVPAAAGDGHAPEGRP